MQEDTQPHPMMQAALQLAAQGYRVFPCLANSKLPSGRWREEASADFGQIVRWWTAQPDANILVVCGKGSYVTVLDFDVKGGKHGELLAAELLGADWKDRYCYIVTPSGGYHIWFVFEAEWGNRKGVGGGGLDIQGEGSYVLVPPSRVEGRPYLTVNPHLPLVNEVNEELRARVLARCETVATRARRVGPMPDWRGLLSGGGGGVQWPERLPEWVMPPLVEGEWGRWGSRTEGLRALYGALYKTLSREQVLALMMHNQHTKEVAQSGNREGRAGDDDAAAEWLWADICRTCVSVFEEGEGPLQRALAFVRRMSPERCLDELKQLCQGCAEELSEPADIEQVWEALHGRGFGISRRLWRAQLSTSVKRVTEEARVAVRAKKLGPVQEYVFVEQQAAFWCLPEPGWYSITGFRTVHGLDDAAFRDTVSGMARCRKSTYRPVNAHAPGFDAQEHRWWLNEDSMRWELNTWQPPTLGLALGEVGDGDVKPWLDHWSKVLRVRPQEVSHVLDWLAYTVQHPGLKLNHMLLLGGEQGLGKDTAIEPVIAALGKVNTLVVGGAQAQDKFDFEKLSHSSLMVLQELSTSDDHREARKAYNSLKNYIAAPPEELPINIKGIKQFFVPNLVNVLALTNDPEAIRIEQDDRRAFMVWCEGREANIPRGYFTKLWRWYREEGGVELVVRWLLQRDLGAFEPAARPPGTNWKERVRDDSLPPVALKLRELFEDGKGCMRWSVVTGDQLLELVQAEMFSTRVTVKQVHDGMKRLQFRARKVKPPMVDGTRGSAKTFYILDRGAEEDWLHADGAALWWHLSMKTGGKFA